MLHAQLTVCNYRIFIFFIMMIWESKILWIHLFLPTPKKFKKITILFSCFFSRFFKSKNQIQNVRLTHVPKNNPYHLRHAFYGYYGNWLWLIANFFYIITYSFHLDFCIFGSHLNPNNEGRIVTVLTKLIAF